MKKKQLILIVSLCVVFVLLLTLALLGKFVWHWFDEKEAEPYTPPALENGEAYYYMGTSMVKDTILMYPQLERRDIFQVRVMNESGERYFFYHNQAGGQNYFALGECESESWVWDSEDLYYPPILAAYGSGFDYTSLYDDTTTLPTMLAAVGTVIINERIKPEGGTVDQAFLARYGLSAADSPAYFELLVYLRDSNGNYIYTPIDEPTCLVGLDSATGKYYRITEEGKRGEEYTAGISTLTPAADTDNSFRVYVGNTTVDDTGYYIYLEGRDIIYTTRSSYLADVVGRSMGYYIAPRLVTEAESVYANQLTPGFTYYKGNYITIPGTEITAGNSVGYTVGNRLTVDSDAGSSLTDLNAFSLTDLFDCDTQLLAALIGRRVGDKFDFILTTPNLSEIGKTEYYRILRVEGILSGDTYVTEAGRVVAAGDRVIISYSDGTAASDGGLATQTGYVDLSSADVPQALKDCLIGLRVGEQHPISGDGSILYTATYDGVSTAPYTIEVRMEKITSVKAADGTALSAVAYGSTVTMAYSFVENGAVIGHYDDTFEIPTLADFDNDIAWTDAGYTQSQLYTMRAFFSELLGKEAGDYLDENEESTLVIEISYPSEYISDFTLHRDTTIEFVTAYTVELAFHYTNDRNVYYGSSVYQISAPSDKTLYGLDASAALEVLQLFQNLTGDETVAAGLDTAAMRKYGLYAYRISYELPMNCYSVDNSDGTVSYYYKNAVGFNLYISEKNADGSRYIGSDQYDIVVRIADGSTFDFVTWDFTTKWVQNNLLMVNYEDLRSLVFDMNFEEEEYKHIWGFDINVDRTYQYPSEYYENGELKVSYTELPRLYAARVDGGAHGGTKTYRELRSVFQYLTTVNTDDYTTLPEALQQQVCAGKSIYTVSDTLRYITELAAGTYTDVDALYGYRNTYEKTDYDGSYSVRTLLQILNSTRYWGNATDDLTPAEIDALMNGTDSCTMTVAMTLSDASGKEYGYTLRFYNYSSHSLVSVTDEQTGGAESHIFYLQSREVQKIAQAVIALTKGETIDPDEY